ncbi:MAG: DUF4266 domain-containing protein [Pseudomonadota bacterium]
MLTAVLLGGCQHVAPWERDILAREDMATKPLVLEAARNTHLRQSREAGSTAATAAGGGCGCY